MWGAFSPKKQTARAAAPERVRSELRRTLGLGWVPPFSPRRGGAGLPVSSEHALVAAWGARFSRGSWVYSDVVVPAPGPGAYLLEAASGRDSARTVVIVGDLAFEVKRSSGEALVYCADRRTGRPWAGARVWSLAAQEGQGRPHGTRLASGRTDAQGLRRGPAAHDAFVLARSGPHFAAARADAPWGEDPSVRVYLYTDRPVYRPGHHVFYKGVVRRADGAGWAAEHGTVKVAVRDPKGGLRLEAEKTLSEAGTFDGELDIPEEPPLGRWSVDAAVGGRSEGVPFEVQAYRKPEFKVSVSASSPTARLGEEASFSVAGEFFHGGPTAGAAVEWTLTRVPFWTWRAEDPLAEDDAEQHYEYGGRQVERGEGVLDAEGRFEVRVPLASEAGPWWAPRDFRFRLNARVTDSGGRQQSGEGSVLATRGDWSFTLAKDRTVAAPGEELRVGVAARGYDGSAVEAPVEWRLERDGGGAVDSALPLSGALLLPRGGAELTLRMPSPGGWRLVVRGRDGAGRPIEASEWLWASGSGASSPAGTGRMVLLTDKRAYKPGEEARLVVAAPAGSPVRISVEGRGVQRSWMSSAPASGFERVRIPDDWSPSVRLTATSFSGGRLYRAARTVRISPEKHLIKVSVEPDRPQAGSDEPVAFTVRARDWQDRPVDAEVSLGVVDAAVYALVPELGGLHAVLSAGPFALRTRRRGGPGRGLRGGRRQGGAGPGPRAAPLRGHDGLAGAVPDGPGRHGRPPPAHAGQPHLLAGDGARRRPAGTRRAGHGGAGHHQGAPRAAPAPALLGRRGRDRGDGGGAEPRRRGRRGDGQPVLGGARRAARERRAARVPHPGPRRGARVLAAARGVPGPGQGDGEGAGRAGLRRRRAGRPRQGARRRARRLGRRAAERAGGLRAGPAGGGRRGLGPGHRPRLGLRRRRPRPGPAGAGRLSLRLRGADHEPLRADFGRGARVPGAQAPRRRAAQGHRQDGGEGRLPAERLPARRRRLGLVEGRPDPSLHERLRALGPVAGLPRGREGGPRGPPARPRVGGAPARRLPDGGARRGRRLLVRGGGRRTGHPGLHALRAQPHGASARRLPRLRRADGARLPAHEAAGPRALRACAWQPGPGRAGRAGDRAPGPRGFAPGRHGELGRSQLRPRLEGGPHADDGRRAPGRPRLRARRPAGRRGPARAPAAAQGLRLGVHPGHRGRRLRPHRLPEVRPSGRRPEGAHGAPQRRRAGDAGPRGAVLPPSLPLSGVQPGENALELSVDGQGEVFYTASLSYRDAGEDLPEQGAPGLRVRRTFERLVPARLAEGPGYRREGVERLRRGDLVLSTLEVESDAAREFLMVEDFLPSGFEPAEGLDGAESEGLGRGWEGRADQRERRDDRVALFMSRLAPGRTVLRTVLRAESAGRVHALPAVAQLPYQPDLRASSAEARLDVGD